MKKVLSVLFWVAVLAVGTTVASAQDAATPVKAEKVVQKVKANLDDERMMPEPAVQLGRLAKGLQLTAEQQKQIQPILEAEYAKLKEIRQNEDISPKQIQKKVEELRTATVTRIQACLTPEQQEKYALVSNEIKSNKQKRIKENRKTLIGTKPDPTEPPKQ